MNTTPVGRATLATATPSLSEPLALIEDALAAAADARLGSDHRQRYLWDAVSMLVQVVAYQQEQIGWLEAAEQLRAVQP